MKTKIVATIGPASKDRVTLEKMVDAGLDVARLNFSHGKKKEFKKWIEIFRDISKEKNQPIAIIQDLQGPRIRIAGLKKPIKVKEGQEVEVTNEGKTKRGKTLSIPLTYKTLLKDVKENDRILIDNGKIELKVVETKKKHLKANVVIGGEIGSHKGINLPDTDISLPTITKKDKQDLKFGAKNKVDYIAFSFVRKPGDVKKARKLIDKEAEKKIGIIAKIETKEALSNLEEIVKEVDGIMIARGDLGIELPMEEVPPAQKRMIRICRENGKPVITATQMLSSMVKNPHPTRAEVSDVANAILDGTDAVMLSEESAMGNYPVKTIKQMSKIIEETEKGTDYNNTFQYEKAPEETKAVGTSACELANQLKVKYITCATSSGFTARMISLHRPDTPIISFTPNKDVYQKMALVWGVEPRLLPGFHTTDELIYQIVDKLKELEKAKKNDLIIITAGHPVGRKGNTNLLKIQKIN